jgi:hypothetical protein
MGVLASNSKLDEHPSFFPSSFSSLPGACKSTRGAIFSSGITVGYTVSLLVLCVAMGITSFSPLVSRFTNCSGFSADDLKEVSKNGALCVEGNTGSNPTMLQQSDKVNSLIYVATRVACFFAGVVLSFLAVFMIKFTSTSAYHYEEELKEESKEGQGVAASGYTVRVSRILFFSPFPFPFAFALLLLLLLLGTL